VIAASAAAASAALVSGGSSNATGDDACWAAPPIEAHAQRAISPAWRGDCHSGQLLHSPCKSVSAMIVALLRATGVRPERIPLSFWKGTSESSLCWLLVLWRHGAVGRISVSRKSSARPAGTSSEFHFTIAIHDGAMPHKTSNQQQRTIRRPSKKDKAGNPFGRTPGCANKATIIARRSYRAR